MKHITLCDVVKIRGNRRIEKSGLYLFIFLIVSEYVACKRIWNEITYCYSFL